MSSIIRIYNPRKLPYGSLSNEASYFMIVNGERYYTVSNYIYSSIVQFPSHRVLLQKYKPGIEYTLEEKEEKAVKDFIKKKIQPLGFESPQAMDLLIEFGATAKAPSIILDVSDLLNQIPVDRYDEFFTEYLEQTSQSFPVFVQNFEQKISLEEQVPIDTEVIQRQFKRPLKRKFEEQKEQEEEAIAVVEEITPPQRAAVISLREMFNKLYRDEINQTTLLALQKGYEQKMLDPSFREQLVESQTSRLVFESVNTFLGVDPETGNGDNMVGKILMQLRATLLGKEREKRVKQVTQDLKDELLTAFQVAKGLQNLSVVEISEYKNMTPNEILPLLKNKLEVDADALLRLYEQGDLSEDVMIALEYPSQITDYIQSKITLKRIPKETVFNFFLDFLLERDYPDLPKSLYEEAKKEQLNTIERDQVQELIDRVYDLYQLKQLPKVVLQKIASQEKEVVHVEDFVLDPTKHRVFPRQEKVKFEQNPAEIIKINLEHPFSPYAFSSMLDIEGYDFPTVLHFVLFELLELIEGITPAIAHELIMSNPLAPKVPESYLALPFLENKYRRIRDENFYNRMRYYAARGLDAKFANRDMQSLLLQTKNARLIYNDHKDSILGVGPRGVQGQNFVGMYLEQIRARLRADLKPKIKENTKEEVLSLLNEHADVWNWIVEKLRDICTVAMLLQNHISVNSKVMESYNDVFIMRVIELIYQCSSILNLSFSENERPPEIFEQIVRSFNKNITVDESAINLLWRYALNLVYTLTRYMVEMEIQDPTVAIQKVERMVTKEKMCFNIVPNSYDLNCILSALLNLTKRIKLFTEPYISPPLNPTDVHLAQSILIPSWIQEQAYQPIQISSSNQPSLIQSPEKSQIQNDEGEMNTIMEKLLLEILSNEVKGDYTQLMDLSTVFISVAQSIKNTKEISDNVKRNRVNFFAST